VRNAVDENGVASNILGVNRMAYLSPRTGRRTRLAGALRRRRWRDGALRDARGARQRLPRTARCRGALLPRCWRRLPPLFTPTSGDQRLHRADAISSAVPWRCRLPSLRIAPYATFRAGWRAGERRFGMGMGAA